MRIHKIKCGGYEYSVRAPSRSIAKKILRKNLDKHGGGFELYVYPTIRQRYPAHKGFRIHRSRFLRKVGILDFFVVRGRDRIVIDAKDKLILTSHDINQVDDYALKLGATERIIYIAGDTRVPNAIKNKAKRLDIKIIWTRYRSKNGK
jgi:hypothetical protein